MAHPLALNWTSSWRPMPSSRSFENDMASLRDLVEGYSNGKGRRVPPVAQKLLLGPSFMRLAELHSVEGVYFVSNCLHRVAAAHILGYQRLRADVTAFRLRTRAPRGLLLWLRGLASSARSSERPQAQGAPGPAERC